MNLSLSDEQEFLREAASGSLARVKTVEAAREALEDPSALPDLWPLVKDAGWNGLLISEERGGAGLGGFEAMLVLEECGKVLAPTPLLGLLPASAILDAAGDESLAAVAGGDVRPAYVPARPPSDIDAEWSVESVSGFARGAAVRIAADGSVTGTVAWVPDAPGADLLVVVGVDADGAPAAVAVDAADATIEPATRYDATRSLGHVTFDHAAGRRLQVTERDLEYAWYLAQTLIASESLGSVQTTLAMSLEYAKERFTFGRAIGSYQSVKHELTEVLRRMENSRSLQFYAGWAAADKPDEFALAASAFRNAAGHALDHATRSNINVHGGIGATWEHDAPLFFRRAQLSRRLLGGTHDAADRVASELLLAAAAA
ncbi:MAG: acyl-CoA dehydrogenase [Solirubrobacterales bacterium]|nr:acyl-CoA dehydrogenase [Solirubrobacterales bacterium]